MAAPARIASTNATLGSNILRTVGRARAVDKAVSQEPSAPFSLPPRSRPVPGRLQNQSIPKRYFNPSPLQEVGQASPGQPPDENKVKLGNSE